MDQERALGFLASSSVSLQSSLNDVFSRLVLSLSHPYEAGDWIKD